MKIPVVITEKEYRKGKPAFDEAEDRYGWVVTAQSESDVAAAVSKSGAKIAVLGVEKYKGPLYEALAGNAAGAKALIARYGVGYDGVDMGECARHGIVLTITPGALDRSVAEHAMALMLGFARNLVFGDSEMRSGRFSPRTGFELAGKKVADRGIRQYRQAIGAHGRIRFRHECIGLRCLFPSMSWRRGKVSEARNSCSAMGLPTAPVISTNSPAPRISFRCICPSCPPH